MSEEARLMRVLWDLAYRVGPVNLSVGGGHGTHYTVMVGKHSFTAGQPEQLLPELEAWATVLRYEPAAPPDGGAA